MGNWRRDDIRPLASEAPRAPPTTHQPHQRPSLHKQRDRAVLVAPEQTAYPRLSRVKIPFVIRRPILTVDVGDRRVHGVSRRSPRAGGRYERHKPEVDQFAPRPLHPPAGGIVNDWAPALCGQPLPPRVALPIRGRRKLGHDHEQQLSRPRRTFPSEFGMREQQPHPLKRLGTWPGALVR